MFVAKQRIRIAQFSTFAILGILIAPYGFFMENENLKISLICRN